MTIDELQNRIKLLEAENAALRQQLERAEDIAGIKRGLQDFKEGRFKPLREFDAEMRAKYNIPPKPLTKK